MDAHHAELGTAVQCRHRFAGVQQPELIERVLDRVEDSQFGRAELHTHLVDLFHTYAVLTGDGAADFHAQYEDSGTELLGTPELVVVIRIEHDEWMQIAIAGMEHIRALQGKLL